MEESIFVSVENSFSDENSNTINIVNSKKLNLNKNSFKNSEQSIKLVHSGLNAKRVEITNISQTEEAINILDKVLKKDDNINNITKSIKSNLSNKISDVKEKYSSTLEELRELDERDCKDSQEEIENSLNENEEDHEYQYNINESYYAEAENDKKQEGVGLKSYEKFGLNERYTPAYLCSNNKITHKLLPYKYKDDSKYKMRLINYLKKDVLNKFKTDSCSYVKMIKNNKMSYKNKLFLKKNRSHKLSDIIKNHSNYLDIINRNINKSKFFEVEDNNIKIPFKIYDDCDIGIEAKWQIQLKITEMDDDVDSDEDQLKAAQRHINKDNKDTVFKIKDNIIKTRNLHRFNDYIKCQPKIILLNGKFLS